MQHLLSRERDPAEQLMARARVEFEALGFIPAYTAAHLAAQGIDVGALENRLEVQTWR